MRQKINNLFKGRDNFIAFLAFIPAAGYFLLSNQTGKLIMTALFALIALGYLYAYSLSDKFKTSSNRKKTIEIIASLVGISILIVFMTSRSSIPVSLQDASNTFQLQGNSMSPYFKDGDILEITPTTDIKRGDVVMYKLTNDVRIVGRIIAMPRESISINYCEVIIDGKRLDEPYLAEDTCTQGRKQIPNGSITRSLGESYFILGDNRESSYDSRDIGVVPQEDIVGKVAKKVN